MGIIIFFPCTPEPTFSRSKNTCMSKRSVVTKWVKDLVFDSHIKDQVVRIDSDGHDGPGPKSLLLTALTGCTGVDVVDILKKMRVKIDRLEISAETELADDYPKVFKDIYLKYTFFGKDIKRKKVERAVDLSLGKYCAVTAMLLKNAPIHHSIEIREDETD
jgi:putative redox protein